MALRAVIVDDDAAFIAAAQRLLEQEGIVVAGVASSGAEAVQRVEEVRPDVTLVDMDLGAESGIELAHRFGRHESEAAASVILISAHSQGDFVELIEASPAVGFLAKSELSANAIYELLGDADGGATPSPEKR